MTSSVTQHSVVGIKNGGGAFAGSHTQHTTTRATLIKTKRTTTLKPNHAALSSLGTFSLTWTRRPRIPNQNASGNNTCIPPSGKHEAPAHDSAMATAHQIVTVRPNRR